MSRRPMDDDDAALLALERENAAEWNKDGGGLGDDDDELEAEMAREDARVQKLLNDPRYVARMAAGADDDGDDMGDGDGDIGDDDVLGELAELEGEVHAERGSAPASANRARRASGSAQMEMDEDAMLAEAEEEAERLAREEEEAEAAAAKPKPAVPQRPQPPPRPTPPPYPPRTQQQQVTASSASLTAPPPSAAATSAAELVSLQAHLLDLKRKAVELKKAGKQAQAIEVLRNCKTVQARITDMEAKVAAAADQTSAPAKPTPPPRPSAPSSDSAIAAPTPAVPAHPSSASTVPAPAVSPSMSIRTTLEYDDLISKLDAQIASLTSSMQLVVKEGGGASVAAGSKNAKLLAVQYFQAKKRSVKDRDIVLLARSRGLRPPHSHVEQLSIQRELSFPQLGEEDFFIQLQAVRNLNNPAVVSKPADFNVHVQVAWEYAVDMEGTYKMLSAVPVPSSKMKGPSASFGSVGDSGSGSGSGSGSACVTVPFPCSRAPSSRDRSSLKRLMRSKMVLSLWHKRFLLGSLEVGRAEVKMKEFALKAEVAVTLKLKDPGSMQRTGEVDVLLRVRKPFEGMDLRTEQLSVIVVDEFEEEQPIVPSVAAQVQQHLVPPPSVSAASASPVTPSTAYNTVATATAAAAAAAASPAAPAASPASATAPAAPAAAASTGGLDLSDPHDVVRMRSNDVLEAEVALLESQLRALGAPTPGSPQSEELESVQERLTAVRVQLDVLVTAVQKGNLTLEQYLAGLKESILEEGRMAVALGRAGRKADAMRVLQRVKIMKAELQNAEENQEELEQC